MRRKCSMRVNAILGEGISLESQVCRFEGPRRSGLLKTNEKKSPIPSENIADTRFECS